ncbi:hypothetical protein NCG89_00880 [Spongiibacter taiwanensis]|nr:hypothetical protein [Spongiibacter taiwanensis]USA43357.1 hypothetical protein NCG89_00880 [Spongiibacter taiwanensis]
MTAEKLLPAAMMVLQLGSATPYLMCGDWRKGLYWLFAAGLTYVVTF